MVIFDFNIFLYNYTFYSCYNTVWIADTEIGLDPNNSVIKRLWCICKHCQSNLLLVFVKQNDGVGC